MIMIPPQNLLNHHNASLASLQSPPALPTLTHTNFAFLSSLFSWRPVQPTFSPPIFPTPPPLSQQPITPRIQANFSFTSLLARISGYPFRLFLVSAEPTSARISIT